MLTIATADALVSDFDFEVALVCLREAEDFEDAIRNAISIGGDSDTLAAFTGSVAEAKGPVPADIAGDTLSRLDKRLLHTHLRFTSLVEERQF